MNATIPVFLHELIDRINTNRARGLEGLLPNWNLISRVGDLMPFDSFLSDLTALVERYELASRENQSQSDRLQSLKYPNLAGKNWKVELHTWMQEVLDAFLGFHVEVPESPDFNRAQRRLMKKFKLLLFFVPQIEESQYPEHMIKSDWNRFLSGVGVTPLSFPGRWVTFEVIEKPNYQDGKYPDDQLMAAVSIETRFNHPHSEKSEGDDLMQDILPKVAKVLAPLGGTTKVQSAKLFNFMGNLLNWLTQHTADSFPDLGATNSVEWCEERCGSRSALFVGSSRHGGLAFVSRYWSDVRHIGIAFRFLA